MKFLARGGPVEHFGPEFCVEISPPFASKLISSFFVAGSGISSNMVFSQPSNAKEVFTEKSCETPGCFSTELAQITLTGVIKMTNLDKIA